MDLQPLGTGRLLGSGPALGLAERPTAVPRPRGAQRPVPDCSSDFAHLTLSGLRAYRSVLAREEGQVSYWRRILQARLDVVREGRLGTVDSSHLRPVLTDERVGSGRSALVELLPVDDIPPLPSLGELWDRAVDPADRAGTERLEADLHAAETHLSEYRATLHRRIGDATGELIARYRQQPALCLSALPARPTRRAAC